MDIADIVAFWRGQQKADAHGRWTHQIDQDVLGTGPHSFNLDHPVSPYIGDVLIAPVIILNANAGYNPVQTPTEFPDAPSVSAYTARVDDPSGSDWSFVSRYYNDTNYGHLVASGKVVVVNACAYRSPRISDKNEADNRAMIKRLPSSIMMRRWLLEAILPIAAKGHRLIINNRGQHWRLGHAAPAPGIVRDPCPASPRITSTALSAMNDFLGNRA
ncbi:hypothetical protein [Sphingomonas sp. Leaf339]|uniref:hypothetical protein n=1 Tax=Sphingomonas sp. Leaf339 TaxID=1736343 RepID=UPI000A5C74EB|nr:hypothetical protein [Sphingomonas sp. Leaf339]